MKIFKLHPDMDARHYPLTKEIYLEMTSRMPPYVMLESDGKMRHYAVCPACNNPVQIIGLHQQKVERAIYAKHIPKTIPRLATYRQAAYENCPLAAKSRIQAEKSARKSGNDDLAPQILHIIEQHFDRIVRVLQQALGIIISPKLAQALLEDYLAEEGYRYKYASLINIPWMIGYFARAKSLVYCLVKDEAMKKSIAEHEPNVVFSGDKLDKKGKSFLHIDMYFSRHDIRPEGDAITESMDMVIVSHKNGVKKELFRKRIVFDYDSFQYLLNTPEGKGKRREDLLTIAHQILQQAG